MANTYFQFKQFTVHQSQTAMKVCTDACLFGAWSALQLPSIQHHTILDIGTGTGLLTLMLAQKALPTTQLHSIEIEPKAFEEANSNFSISPWHHQITNHFSAIQSFESNEKFDVIISNPPFYEGDLASPSKNKNLAHHAAALSWEDLCFHTNRLLMENGTFFVLIPAARAYTMQKLAEKENLFLQNETLVFHQKQTKIPFRSMLQFGRTNNANIIREQIYIKQDKDLYAERFKALLSDYYLHL